MAMKRLKFTQTQLKTQLAGLEASGLLSLCEQAVKERGVPLNWVLAVASRETNMTNISGDGGHGHGLMQIDDRAHPDICQQHDFRTEPGEFIDYACKLLAQNYNWAKRTWPQQTLQGWFKLASAAYNCGPGNTRDAAKTGDCDARTRYGDYGWDVCQRMTALESLLPTVASATPTKTTKAMASAPSSAPAKSVIGKTQSGKSPK
jgi:hypothetical protein